MTNRATSRDLSAVWNEEVEAALDLAAAGWSVAVRGDEIADIRFHGELVLRGLRVVVRDHASGTPPPSVDVRRVTKGEDSLELELAVSYRENVVDFRWVGRLALTPSALTFSFEGEALAPFQSNRIGIVVLHPPTLAVLLLTVTDPRGQVLRHRSASRSPRTSLRGTSRPSTGRRPADAPRAWISSVTYSRWKTSATGPMPRTRPTARRLPCRFPCWLRPEGSSPNPWR